ncbi:DUF874 family protein, partial [Helicobacter pylori]|uniref:DUF874 family protein n=1 Tax=Helicobacter pylori TaxID=210 RepID=UPI001BB35D3A
NKINWWKYSGLTIATSLLLAACSVGDVSEQIELEQEKKEVENARDRANKSGIELEQEKQKTNKSEIELANSQIKTEQEKQKTEQEKQKTNKSGIELEQQKQKTEQEKQKTIKTQKDFIKDLEQNCKENHGQFFIKKVGIKGGIAIEIEAECKTPKSTKTNQTPIQP